jgi:hypothetical protein
MLSERYFEKCLQSETGYLKERVKMKVRVEKKRQRKTNSGMTIHNLDFVHI